MELTDDYISDVFRKKWARLCVVSDNVLHDKHMAEDVVSTIFLRIILHRDRYRPGEGLMALMAIAVKRLSFTYLVRKNRWRMGDDFLDLHAFAQEEEERMMGSDRLRRIYQYFNRSSPRMAKVFALTYCQAMTLGEAAQVMGIARNTVKIHRQRIAIKLKDIKK